MSITNITDKERALSAEVKQLKEELLEQARIVGMSTDREYALAGKIARQEKVLKLALEWIEAQPQPRMLGALKAITAIREALSADALAEQPAQHKWFDVLAITVAYEQGVGKGHQAYQRKAEIENPYTPGNCNEAWRLGYEEGQDQAKRKAEYVQPAQQQEPACKRCNSYATLVKSLDAQISIHKRQADKYREAIASLESERAANEILTKELEQIDPSPQQQEPLEYWNAVEGWVKIDEVRQHFASVGCGTIYKTAGEGRVPLYLAEYHPPREQVEQPARQEPVKAPYHVPNFKDFLDWASAAGYDAAYTNDGTKFICLNPMTKELWGAWQASAAITPPAQQQEFECPRCGHCCPTQQQESVWLVPTEEIHNEEETYTLHDVRLPLCDAERLYTSPQPAQQEPVAVVSGYYGGQCVIVPTNPAMLLNPETALYTSPPQRKPLMEEEIKKIWGSYFSRGIDFARAIEAAHGIKE